MRNTTFLFGSFAFLIPLLFVLNRPEPAKKSFFIEDESELYLKGSSNVNDFTCMCLCYEKSREHNILLEPGQAGRAVRFENAFLRLQTKQLDCQHQGINKDLYKTLHADQHPAIVIELLRAEQVGAQLVSQQKDWVKIKAQTAITLAGVRKEVVIDVRGQKIGPNKYRFVGSKGVLMSDFNLEPPKPLFGLVKVDDLITINLDLVIRIADA